jgi:hypothetical protein
MQKCTTQSMEATNDGSRIGGDWFALKVQARILLVAALAVGYLLATPALAIAPKQLVILRTPASAKAYAHTQLHKYGWNSKTQWDSLLLLWQRESNWRPNAKNHTPVRMTVNGKTVQLYAGGIPQRLGLNPKASVQKQIQVGLDYVQARYGSPAKALAFWNQHNYY